MQSPYKRIVTYDLETGGLKSNFNSITEIAMVAIDMENLDIIEEFSVMLQPRLDLSIREEGSIREAKELFKQLKIKDEASNMNVLPYKGHQITLKNLEPLAEDIELFYKFLKKYGNVLDYEKILDLGESDKYRDITKMYFDKCYNPQALEATHISRELMVKEGVPYEEAFKLTNEMLKRHTVGNKLPILAGHNIKDFDNKFLFRFFLDNFIKLENVINKTQMMDTLEMARIKWYEASAYNLGACCNMVGLTLKEAHRALPDTMANAKLLIKMLKNLRGEGSQKSTYKRRRFQLNF